MIWINGQLRDSLTQLSVFDKINIGLTVFTTMLGHKKPNGGVMIVHGRAHYARLVRHASVLGLSIPYTEEQLLSGAGKVMRDIQGEFFAVRMQVTAGEGPRGLAYPDQQTVFITASPIDNPELASPVRVKIEREIIMSSTDPMNRIKSNYALRAVAKNRAVAEGFDDVLMMNDMNAVTSSSVGNVIVKVEGVLKTPPIRDGVIDGIRRSVLLKSMPIHEVSVSSADFVYCDAAWIINSLGIRSIMEIDGVAKPVEILQ
jgi:branched-chain amino acid aminotransferase